MNTLREAGEQQPLSGGLLRSHSTLKPELTGMREVDAKDAELKQQEES